MTPDQLAHLVQLGRCALTGVKVQADDAAMLGLWASIQAGALEVERLKKDQANAPVSE